MEMDTANATTINTTMLMSFPLIVIATDLFYHSHFHLIRKTRPRALTGDDAAAAGPRCLPLQFPVH
jgi:hypothetical protein